MKMRMRMTLFLVIMGFTTQIMAEDKFSCRFDLVGSAQFPESVLEEKQMTLEECKTRASALLKLNSENYDKVIIYQSNSKLVVIKLSDLKKD